MANKKYNYWFGLVFLTFCIQFHEIEALQSSYRPSRIGSCLFSTAPAVESPTRRRTIASGAVLFAILSLPLPSNANDVAVAAAVEAEALLQVTVTVSPSAYDSVQQMDRSSSALYITARPSTSDDVLVQ